MTARVAEPVATQSPETQSTEMTNAEKPSPRLPLVFWSLEALRGWTLGART
jgi:hypothetical protein